MSEQYTGKNVSYYLCPVTEPKRGEPYIAECEDIILALGMSFEDGCAFKALWRKNAARQFGITKRGYGEDGPLYDAEKVEHYGGLSAEQERRRLRKHKTQFVEWQSNWRKDNG